MTYIIETIDSIAGKLELAIKTDYDEDYGTLYIYAIRIRGAFFALSMTNVDKSFYKILDGNYCSEYNPIKVIKESEYYMFRGRDNLSELMLSYETVQKLIELMEIVKHEPDPEYA